MRDISVFPFSACWFLGGAACVPWPPAFSHWNRPSPQLHPMLSAMEWNITTTVTPNVSAMEWNITTTVTPNSFSHGMEHHHHSYTRRFHHGMEHHHHSYTQCFQPWDGTSPPQLHPMLSAMEWNITTVTPNVFSHGMEHHHHSYTQRFQPWNGTHHHRYSYTQRFQPWDGTSPPQLHPMLSAMEWNITVTPNVFSHGMEHHHHCYTQCFQPWNGTSPPQLHPTFSPWNGTSPPQLHQVLSAMDWNITTTVTHNDQLAWTHSVPVSQWSLSADLNSFTPVTQ